MSEHEPLEAELVEADEPRESSSELAVAERLLPHTLHILPLTDRPFFPAQAVPVVMDEKPWLKTIKAIGETEQHMAGLVLIKEGSAEAPRPAQFNSVGTVVRMHNPARTSGKIQFIAEGVQRFRILKWLSDAPPYLVQVEYPIEDKRDNDKEVRAYAMAVINAIKELIPHNPLYSEELKFFLDRFSPNEPSALCDFAASLSSTSKEELQEVLETIPLLRRMEKVLLLIKKELDVAKLQSQIRQRVEERMSEQQRRFFLREQLKEIQKELGLEKDDRTADVERFRERLKPLTLPEKVAQRVEDELQKLSILESGSPEYTVTRNYLDWITAPPGVTTAKISWTWSGPGPSWTVTTTAWTM